MSEVLEYLQSKNLHLKAAGSNEVHFACLFCGEDEGKRGRLYVNIDPSQEPPGQFKCHLCGETGAYLKLRKKFGDPVKTEQEPDNDRTYKVNEVWRDACQWYHNSLADDENPAAQRALKYLKEDRGLTLDTIMTHKLGWAGGDLRKYLTSRGHVLKDIAETGLIDSKGNDFLHGVITIPYLVSDKCVLIRGKLIGGKYLTPHGQKARLFNSDVTFGTDTVIITEGEFDALVLEQLGFAAVGVPGATAWQQRWNDYFQDTKRPFVCLDNDEPGRAGAEKIATNLGSKARIITMPEADPGKPKNDPTEWIAVQGHTREDFDLLLIKSGSGLLFSVHDAYEAWVEYSKIPGLKLGWDTIDTATGGLRPYQVAIVLANTGVGKTLWAINTFYWMIQSKPDIRILFISLEQTKEEWAERALRIHRFHNLDSSDRECLDYYANHLLIVEKNRLGEEELVNCIDQYEYELGGKPHIVFVDYLGYWARGFGRDSYERTTDAVHALKAIAKDRNVIFCCPHQVNRSTKRGARPAIESGRDSGAIEETADLHFSLWREDQQEGRDKSDWTGEVRLALNKSRQGGDGEIQSIYFAPSSLAMIPKGHHLKERQEDDLQWYKLGSNYGQVMYRHLIQFDEVEPPAKWKEIVREQWPSIQFQ